MLLLVDLDLDSVLSNRITVRQQLTLQAKLGEVGIV